MITSIFAAFLLPLVQPDDKPMVVRIADVGQGQCCVIAAPDENGRKHVLVFDTGLTENVNYAVRAIRQVAPGAKRVDFLVLSHTDSDHTGGSPTLISKYRPRTVLRPDYPTQHLSKTAKAIWIDAITKIEAIPNVVDFKIGSCETSHGKTWSLGLAKITVVSGFDQPPAEWAFTAGSGEHKNAGSIVLKVEFGGNSILLCGDALGQDRGDTADEAKYAELHMIVRHKALLPSTVLVAGHHGGDNACSPAFVREVDPKGVVFCSGRGHGHPRKEVAGRLGLMGPNPSRWWFRTDRGDSDDRTDHHWDDGNQKDIPGDDDIKLVFFPDGNMHKFYIKKAKK
jgi:competence protein ComEC